MSIKTLAIHDYCLGCGGIKLRHSMAFTPSGLYRCHDCRQPEKAILVRPKRQLPTIPRVRLSSKWAVRIAAGLAVTSGVWLSFAQNHEMAAAKHQQDQMVAEYQGRAVADDHRSLDLAQQQWVAEQQYPGHDGCVMAFNVTDCWDRGMHCRSGSLPLIGTPDVTTSAFKAGYCEPPIPPWKPLPEPINTPEPPAPLQPNPVGP